MLAGEASNLGSGVNPVLTPRFQEIGSCFITVSLPNHLPGLICRETEKKYPLTYSLGLGWECAMGFWGTLFNFLLLK